MGQEFAGQIAAPAFPSGTSLAAIPKADHNDCVWKREGQAQGVVKAGRVCCGDRPWIFLIAEAVLAGKGTLSPRQNQARPCLLRSVRLPQSVTTGAPTANPATFLCYFSLDPASPLMEVTSITE